MSLTSQHCKVHLVVINVISIIINFAMVIHTLAKKKTGNKTVLLFQGIGMSNFLLSTYFICRTFVFVLESESADEITLIHSVAYSFSVGLTCLHLAMNLALAFNRLCMVAWPFDYANDQENRRFQKRLLIGVVSSSLTIGILTGIISTVTRTRLFYNWAHTVCRILTHILLSVTYVTIFKKVKIQNKHYNGEKRKKDVANAESQVLSSRSKYREEYLKKLFTGITTSFFCFNIPITIAAPFNNIFVSCDTFRGRLMIAAMTFFMLGLVFDPIWYFFLEYLANRRKTNKRRRQPMREEVPLAMDSGDVKPEGPRIDRTL